MGSGAQANFMRRDPDQPVKMVMGLVMEGDTNCHGWERRVKVIG